MIQNVMTRCCFGIGTRGIVRMIVVVGRVRRDGNALLCTRLRLRRNLTLQMMILLLKTVISEIGRSPK